MIDNYSIPIVIHKAGIYIFQTLAGRQMTESYRYMFKSRSRVSWKAQYLKYNRLNCHVLLQLPSKS